MGNVSFLGCVVDDSLLIAAPINCRRFVLVPSFAMQNIVPFLVLQVFRCGRESWLFYFK